MANININNLQPTEIEFSELSDLELEAVVGGKGGFLGKVGNQIDRTVRNRLGGWVNVGVKAAEIIIPILL